MQRDYRVDVRISVRLIAARLVSRRMYNPPTSYLVPIGSWSRCHPARHNRQIGAPGTEATILGALDDHNVGTHLSPKSRLGLPAMVTTPALVGCVNCRWLPLS